MNDLNVKQRVSVIRFRTWTLTVSICVTLVLYFFVQIGVSNTFNPIDFFFLTLVQLLTFFLYFPDGELYGMTGKVFCENKKAYNDKANDINLKKLNSQLRVYCIVDFNERKKNYIENELAKIDITQKEFEILKTKTQEDIKCLKRLDFDGKIKIFTKHKIKILNDLMFKDIPVEPNNPETIMSAIENERSKAIHDGSLLYRKQSYIKKILSAILIGGTFAYIGYTLRDGIGIAEIVNICMYLTTLFSTAVTAYSNGEICSKVYKNNFYILLTNFIERFFEWNEKVPQTIDNDSLKTYNVDKMI